MNKKACILFLLLLMTACQTPEVSPTLPPPTETTLSTPAVSTPIEPTVTHTAVAPPTAVVPPTAVPSPTPVPTVTAVATTESNAEFPPEVVAWVQENAVEIDTAVPGQGCEDLAPLLDAIGDARVVALGEGTHGTSEFFTMKHRLVECLVQEKGFNHFAIEANYPETKRVNAYIQNGESTVSQVVQGMLFWTWNTQEVVDMVEWMRTYNQTVPNDEQITFSGFDMQFINVAFSQLSDYLDQINAPIIPEIKQNLSCIGNYRPINRYRVVSDEIKQTCRTGIEVAMQLMVGNEAIFISQSSELAFAEGFQLLKIIQQGEVTASNPTIIGPRDAAMAENVLWLMAQAPEDKLILWAHNAHIQEVGIDISSRLYTIGDEVIENDLFLPMGTILSDQLGDSYVTVGFTFFGGSFNAVDMSGSGRIMAQEVLPPLPDSYEPLLNTVDAEQFYLDVRRIADAETAVADWFAMPHWVRSIGAVYPKLPVESLSFYMPLPEAFDIVIHFEESSPTVLRP